MMIKADFHLHTEYSYDSELKLAEVIETAQKQNYDLIAITEHLDLLPQELGAFGLPSFSRYMKELKPIKQSLKNMELLIGVEIGDYQCHPDFAKRLIEQFDFDLIIGSVHFLADHTNVAIPISRRMDKYAIREYYESNLKLAETCDIDILAHLGVYKRFFTEMPDESYSLPVIKDIFRAMIDREIALELNNSCLRKTYGKVLPEPEYIELYRDMGGKLFSLASDAHHITHFDTHYASFPDFLTQQAAFSNKKSRVLIAADQFPA